MGAVKAAAVGGCDNNCDGSCCLVVGDRWCC